MPGTSPPEPPSSLLLSDTSTPAEDEQRPRGYPPSRPLDRWTKRRLSDAVLNTMEDYNKMIASTEAVASGSIAVTAAYVSLAVDV